RWTHLDAIPPDAAQWGVSVRGADRLAATLREQMEQALLFRRLATLRLDVPLPQTAEGLRWNGAPRERWSTLCDELGFDSLRERPHRWTGGGEFEVPRGPRADRGAGPVRSRAAVLPHHASRGAAARRNPDCAGPVASPRAARAAAPRACAPADRASHRSRPRGRRAPRRPSTPRSRSRTGSRPGS